MPKINRIRIINFVYNHDRRHILDETFNFYGGENALLSLANGGGKSVLVQLMLQPVVPGAKLQGRPIISFFRRRKLPSYVLLEWKLDGGGGYLLTGIALASQEVKGIDDDERSRLKYFTFTVQYPQAHAYDIVHVELVTRQGGVLTVKPFREAAQMLAEKARRDPVHFAYFTQEDGYQYAAHLNSYGISQEEWRNIIARINDSESGLKEVFEKCRTSDQLLNTWLIKTVEKVLYRDRDEARRLEEMLANLVQEIIDNERYIIEKEMLVAFLKGFGEFSDSLAELVNDLEEEQKLKSKLVAFHALVTEAIKTFQEEKIHREEAIEQTREALDRLLLEEKSFIYHRCKEEYDKLFALWQEAEEKKDQTAREIEAAKREKKLQEAARLAQAREELSAALAALEEKLSLLQAEIDTDDRIKRLEYSLKLGYEELLDRLEGELKSLLAKEGDYTTRKQELTDRLQSLDTRRVELSTEQGQLEERVRSFEDYQQEVEARLGFGIKRDLFGRLDEQEALAIQEKLENRHQSLISLAEKLREQQVKARVRLEEIGQEQLDLQAAKTETANRLTQLQEELNQYLELEEKLVQVCRCHGLDFKKRFEPGALENAFQEQIEDLERRRYNVAREKELVSETINALHRGMLHIPAGLVHFLEEEDIDFTTGEAYLGSQPKEIREKLLAGNPLLPYSLIMTQENLDKLLAISNEFTLRQAIPVFTYEDLSVAFTGKDRWVKPVDNLTLMCLYEGRMSDANELQELMAQLERELKQYEENHRHLEEALILIRQDQAFTAQFSYTQDYRTQLEQELARAQKTLADLAKKEQELALEKEHLTGVLQDLERQIAGNQQEQHQAKERLEIYTDFLRRNRPYQAARRRLEQIRAEKEQAETLKDSLEQELEKLREEMRWLKETIAALQKMEEDYRVKYRLVENAPEAPPEAGTVEELEAKLKALQEKHRDTLGSLEEARKRTADELARKTREMEKLGIPQEEYAQVVYQEERADWLEEEILRLEKLLSDQVEQASAARARASAQESSLKHALEEVKKLNVPEPLEPSEIKGDFRERRRELNQELAKLEQDRQRIGELINRYTNLAGSVQVVTDLAGVPGDPELTLDEEPERQFKLLSGGYRQKEQSNRTQLEKRWHEYLKLRQDYMDKKQYLTDIFAGLDTLWEQARTGFAGCYYLYERSQQQLEMLNNMLRFYESRLANLERNKQDMVQQSYFHGLQIYEELHKISECSRVRIQGRSRPVDMLRINMQLEEGEHETARQRIKQYVEECIRIVREDLRQGKREDEVRKTIGRLMSSRELLNQLLGTSRIPVSVYKIELTMQHSRHKIWDDAIKENSGGEKFVVFFSVLAALMAYTRLSTMGEMGLNLEHVSRVLIMDNPFGPISSEHLLRPLFDIAEKHNTQLICLSDLKQSSIMNCFNLIFMLKVRTGFTGEKEYLSKEKIYTKDNVLASGDENLEKAIFRTSEVTQITLFDYFEQ